MKRKAGVMVLLGALAGWGSPAVQAGPFMSQYWNQNPDGASPNVRVVNGAPNLIGPYGQPVPAMAPASFNQASAGGDYARAALAQNFPPELVQQAFAAGMPGGGLQLTGGPMPAPGMPGIGGPGPAIPLSPAPCGVLHNPPGAVAAIGALTGPGPAAGFGVQRTEIRFVGPAGMRISWYAPRGDGGLGFTTQYLEAPARYNFVQASIYRLKLTDIPYRPGVELYPTLEVVPATPKTATFLAHSAVPVNFTEDDLEQVAAGNFVVKVIYLPDPQFQDLAATGPDEVVSSRLEPGVDPIIEAKRRGCILAIVRLGNIDLEAPNTPAMDAPPGGYHGYPPGYPGGHAAVKPGLPLPPGAMGGLPPGSMPPGMMPPGMMPPGMGGAPTMPAKGGATAPTVPTPLKPSLPPAVTTPLNMTPSH
jgi:hypothetical protein